MTLAAAWALVPAKIRKVIYGAGALVVIYLALSIWMTLHDKAVIRDHEATIAAQTAEISRLAAEAAARAAGEVRSDVATTNERARDAASNSDDPLGDGLRGLRP